MSINFGRGVMLRPKGLKELKENNMGYVNREELVKLLAQYTGFTISDTRELVEGYTTIVERLLRAGHEVRFGDLGRFKLKDMAAQSERKGYSPKTKGTITIAAKPAYKKPEFAFTKSFRKEIRAITEKDGR